MTPEERFLEDLKKLAGDWLEEPDFCPTSGAYWACDCPA